MQFNNFNTQALKYINRDFICSSIIDLLNESIISKIRRWRIELCDNENLSAAKTSKDRKHLTNNLNFSLSLDLQYYWIYTHFLIEYKLFERINNIENSSITHWVIIMVENLNTAKTKIQNFDASLIEIFLFEKRIFLLIESLTKQLRTLPNSQNSNSRYFTIK